MAFKLDCPHCKRKLNVTEKAFGKTVPCPGCNRPIKVPNPTAVPLPAPVERSAPWVDSAQGGQTTPPAPA